jgi:hypothetical protein
VPCPSEFCVQYFISMWNDLSCIYFSATLITMIDLR